jgi:hypothetical protein
VPDLQTHKLTSGFCVVVTVVVIGIVVVIVVVLVVVFGVVFMKVEGLIVVVEAIGIDECPESAV